MPKITIEISDTVHQLLEALTKGDYAPRTVEGVVTKLVDHAQQGVYRPGAWEREWLTQAFGDDWTHHLETGDPYGRPDSPMFQRPKRGNTGQRQR
jgi:hypothetical protein